MDNSFKDAIGKVRCGHKDGSLFLLSSTLALTALHVLDDAVNSHSQIQVEFPVLKGAGCINAKIVFPYSTDKSNLPDIALLELSKPILDIEPLKLARMELTEGAEWLSFGYPFTREETGQLFKGTVAQGIVKSDTYQYDIDLFCSDPNLSDIDYSATGASGSPILIGGYVVGVLTDVMPGATIGVVTITHCQSILEKNGVNILELGYLPKYIYDIEILKEYTKFELANNSDDSKLRIGNQEIKISREFVEALRLNAEQDSLVVVGDPGTGKSGALNDLVLNLLKKKRDVLYISVDHINAEGIGILRNDLGLKYNLTEVLDNWLGEQPGFLVIDALDAARLEKAAKTIRSIISHIIRANGRWKVVASVRKFDLRYDDNLRRLFKGKNIADYQNIDFHSLRHMQIPNFSINELERISTLIPTLANLIAQADKEFEELIRIPFNLKIICELLDEGIEKGELTLIRTQSELLDRYWSYRVVRSDGQRDAREFLLINVAKEMLRTRSLKVNRSNVVDATTSKALHELLSTNVLSELQLSSMGTLNGSTLVFAHHVIFDYAVNRLLLQGNQEKVLNMLVKEPELILVIRPSFAYYFISLWLSDESRTHFWILVNKLIENENIPEVAKIIGPTVATEFGTEISDFSPLLELVSKEGQDSSVTAQQALIYLIGGLLTVSGEVPLVGKLAGPWCELAEITSENINSSIVFAIKALVSVLCKELDDFNREDLERVGIAARRLLEYALNKEPENDQLIGGALVFVCRTFSSNKKESENLLRNLILPERIKAGKYKELNSLAKELPSLFMLAPKFVADVYCNIFSHKENSKQATNIGGSRILPLQSNRQQDFDMILFELGEIFPGFLKQKPLVATNTLISVLEDYVESRHKYGSSVYEEKFMYKDLEVDFKSDNSCIWDSEVYYDDIPLTMLNTFQEYIIRLSTDPTKDELLQDIIQIIVSKNKLAVLWRRLIICGKNSPEVLGIEIRSLASAYPILISSDTNRVIGEYLTVIFSHLPIDDRKKIEESILTIPFTLPEVQKDLGIKIRNQLLEYLPQEALVTKGVVQLTKERRSKVITSSNEEVKPKKVEVLTYQQNIRLKRQGIPIDEEQNPCIHKFTSNVRIFIDKYQQAKLVETDIQEINNDLYALESVLDEREKNDIHPKLKEIAWDALTAACSILATFESVIKDRELVDFIKKVLLKGSLNKHPLFQDSEEERFEKSVGWSTPAPRIESAIGIMRLARYQQCMDNDIEQIIKKLSIDDVPAVRFNIVSGLKGLVKTNENLMWNLIKQFAQNEANKAILEILVKDTLHSLSSKCPDKIFELVLNIYSRVPGEGRAEKVREGCALIFLQLFLWEEHISSRDFIFNIIENPVIYYCENSKLVHRLRNTLALGSIETLEPTCERVRCNSWDIIDVIVKKTLEAWTEFQDPISRNELTEEDQALVSRIANIAHSVCMQVYFASGASDDNNKQGLIDDHELNKARERFLEESYSVLDLLAELNIPSITHYMLQTLEFLVPINPELVFELIGKVVNYGEGGGYHFESLGIKLVVSLVERYLSEFRLIFEESDSCQQILIEILDIFVKAGWPEARRLTYRLDELFR